jgi:hypothetical protein
MQQRKYGYKRLKTAVKKNRVINRVFATLKEKHTKI